MDRSKESDNAFSVEQVVYNTCVASVYSYKAVIIVVVVVAVVVAVVM